MSDLLRERGVWYTRKGPQPGMKAFRYVVYFQNDLVTPLGQSTLYTYTREGALELINGWNESGMPNGWSYVLM